MQYENKREIRATVTGFSPFFVCLKKIFSVLQDQALFHEMDLPPVPNKNPSGNKDANRIWVTLGMGMEMNRRQENEEEMDTSKTQFISIGNNAWQYNCPWVNVIKHYGGDGFLLSVTEQLLVLDIFAPCQINQTTDPLQRGPQQWIRFIQALASLWEMWWRIFFLLSEQKALPKPKTKEMQIWRGFLPASSAYSCVRRFP